jgi:hypothetical protein
MQVAISPLSPDEAHVKIVHDLETNRAFLEKLSELRLWPHPQKLTQVLLDIITNSDESMRRRIINVDACQKGQGEVTIAVESHRISMTKEELAIAVSELGRIADPKITGPYPGIGLSLPLYSCFMSLLGGSSKYRAKRERALELTLFCPQARLLSSQRCRMSFDS